MKKSLAVLTAVAGLILACTSAQAASAADRSDSDSASLASYNGRTIDLRVSWEGAQACAISDAGNKCYDTEAQLQEDQWAGRSSVPPSPQVACSSSLRLYDLTSFGTPVVYLSTRGAFISLSAYGFSAKTSSYIVGACSASFYDVNSSVYPGSTAAGASASTMSSGWNNRVTDVFIN